MAIDDSTLDDSGSGYGSFSPMMGPMAQAMHMDPRFALAQAIMQTGQQSLQQPTYTGWGALAKALTMGIGGATTAQLQNQYAGANAGDTAKNLADTLPENHPLRKALTSSDPLVRMYAMQGYGPAMGNLGKVMALKPDQIPATAGGTTTGRSGVPMSPQGQLAADAAAAPNPATATALANVLGKEGQDNGITYSPGGGASLAPGADVAQQRLALAKALGTNQADLQYKPAIAGATAAAENPALIARAGGTAAATAPVEVDKANRIAAFNTLVKPEQVRSGSLTGTPEQLGVDTSIARGALGLPLPGSNLPSVTAPASSPAAPVVPNSAPKPGGVYNSPEANTDAQNLAKETAASRVSADGAYTQKAIYGKMTAAIDGANLGSYSEHRSSWDNLLNTFNIGTKPGERATQDQVFDKMATQVAGQATNQLDQTANAALQTMRKAYPNRDMTKEALKEMVGQLSGLQDYIIQKDLARNTYIHGDPTTGTPGHGTAAGFVQSDWVKNNTPEKFMDEGIKAAGGTPSGSIKPAPESAVGHLKANPALATEFDAKYGKGAAAKALGQ